MIFGYDAGDGRQIVSCLVPRELESLSFFVAALEAALNGDKPMFFMRKTKEEHKVSMFITVRISDGLRVFSCREIEIERSQ